MLVQRLGVWQSLASTLVCQPTGLAMAGRVDRLHHAGLGLEFGGGLTVPTFSGECVAGLTKSNPHISYLFFHNGWSILTLHLKNDLADSSSKRNAL